jgi:hypothetical protein
MSEPIYPTSCDKVHDTGLKKFSPYQKKKPFPYNGPNQM